MLIYAARGSEDAAKLALPYLKPNARRFVTSDYVLLEVLPKAVFHKNTAETEFYQGFFRLNSRVVPTSVELLKLAMVEGCSNGISGLDAIHIAAAVFGGAEEFNNVGAGDKADPSDEVVASRINLRHRVRGVIDHLR